MSSSASNNKRNCDDDNSVVVSDEAEPEADDDHDGPHDGPSLSVPRSWTKDYIKDLKTAYDSETKTAEDNVPILDYFKYLMKPVYVEDEEKEGQDQDYHDGQDDDEGDSSKVIPSKRRIVNEEFANVVGQVPSKLMSEARYQIVEQSQEMFVPSWSRGKINKEDLGYIPPLALLLCLPEQRFHDASETDLERILNAVPNYLDVIKDMLRFWDRDQKYTKLMAKEKKKGITRMFKQNKEIECYKALIFVLRMYAAEKFLNPQRNLSVPPQQPSSSAAAAGDAVQIGLERVDHYLQCMNHHVAVTPKEMKEWREELKELTQRRKRRKLEREIQEQSDSESESESEPESDPEFEVVMMDSPSSRTRSQRTRGRTPTSSSAATRTRTEAAAGHRRTTRRTTRASSPSSSSPSPLTTRAGRAATRPSAAARAAAATATRTERATRERTATPATPVSASPRRVRITRFKRASAGGTKRKTRLDDSDSDSDDDYDDDEASQDELQEDDLFMFK